MPLTPQFYLDPDGTECYWTDEGDANAVLVEIDGAPWVVSLDDPLLQWTPTEPAWQDGCTLYRTEQVVFSNGDVAYTPTTSSSAWKEIGTVKDSAIYDSVVEYAVNTSETVAPTSGWSTSQPTRTPGSFIWIRTVITYGSGSTSTTAPALLTGNTGAKGDAGADGLPGKDGVGLVSTQIRYAKSTSGTVTPTSGWQIEVPASTPGQFLWTRTIWTYSDKSTETGYSVAMWGATGSQGAKGDKGDTGKDGIAGKDGVGITNTVITYTQSTSGTTAPTTGWAENPPTPIAGRYIWTKTVWTYSDGTTETGYSVGKIGDTGAKGDTGADGLPGKAGVDGKDGVGIINTTIQYAKSTSGTTTPTSGWQNTVPNSTPGQFLWTRTTWSYSDGSTENGYSVAQWGATGAKGDKGDTGSDGIAGKDGVGIKSTAISYVQSTSGTTVPSSGWQSTPPSPIAGHYIWTRTIWTYTDNSTEIGYSVGKIGDTGAKGDKGDEGAAGAKGDTGAQGISVTSITPYYAKSSQNMFLGDPEVSTSLITSYGGSKISARYNRPPMGLVYEVLDGTGTDGTLGTIARLRYLDQATRTESHNFPVVSGKSYKYGFSWGVGGNLPSDLAASERSVRISIFWNNADGTRIQTTFAVDQGPGSYVTQFREVYGEAIAPDGAVSAFVYIQKNWFTSGHLFLTNIFFQPATDAPWVDPVPPTTATPGLPWRDTEPAYVAGATLYRTELVKFSNDSFSYTPMTSTDAWKEISETKEEALYVANLAQQAAEGLIVFGEEEPDHAPGRIWFKETTSTNSQGVEVTHQEILASNDAEWDIYTLMTGMLIVPARPDDTNNPDGVPTIVNQDGMTIGYIGAHTITGEVIEARTLKGEQLVLGSLSRKNLDKETQKAVDAAEEMDKYTIFEPGRVVVAEAISNKSGTPNVVSGVEILPRKMNFILEGNTSVYIDSSRSQIGAANIVATNSIYVGQHIIQQAKAGITTVTFVGDL